MYILHFIKIKNSCSLKDTTIGMERTSHELAGRKCLQLTFLTEACVQNILKDYQKSIRKQTS